MDHDQRFAVLFCTVTDEIGNFVSFKPCLEINIDDPIYAPHSDIHVFSLLYILND